MNLCDINVIKPLLQKHGFRFSKSKGQNFLTQSWVPREIAEGAGIDESCGVLEVGPGIGPLTQALCENAGRVVSVEVDATLQPILEETMGGTENFTLIFGDILKTRHSRPGGNPFCRSAPHGLRQPALLYYVAGALPAPGVEMLRVRHRHGAEGSGPADLRPARQQGL